MSMYNILFGQNPIAEVLLATLDLTPKEVGRFRDAFVVDDKIAVYTRNGGGNRGHWDSEEEEEGPDCLCPGCVMEYKLPNHPCYLNDADDEFDCTYATVWFRVPDEFRQLLSRFDIGNFNPDDRWQLMLDELRNNPDSAVFEGLRGLVLRIHKVLERG